MRLSPSSFSTAFEHIDMLEGEPEPFTSEFDAADPEARAELEGTHYWHLHRRAVVRQVLEAELGPSAAAARCLELGCGTGNVATYLNQHGLRVDYGELHQSLLDAAQRRAIKALPATAGARFYRLDITRQFPEGDYDAVLLLDVLEHLPNPEQVLATVRAHLRRKASGLLLFTVPAYAFLWSPWDELNGHFRRYTARTARALAEGAGFQVERLTYFFFPLFFLAAGVKGLRQARDGVRPRRVAAEQAFHSMAEARQSQLLNGVMGQVLGRERQWLQKRDLPCGTSLLCVARPAR